MHHCLNCGRETDNAGSFCDDHCEAEYMDDPADTEETDDEAEDLDGDDR